MNRALTIMGLLAFFAFVVWGLSLEPTGPEAEFLEYRK